MAVSKLTKTYGLLNIWQRINQENIWAFNQAGGTGAPITDCPVYIQDDREQIAETVNEAWHAFASFLGYFPRPIWHEEIIPLGRASPFDFQRLSTKYGYIEAFGQRAASLIQAGAAVTYSASGAVGAINDVATIAVTTNVALDEIQVFFQVADGAIAAGDERYQIEPVQVKAGALPGTVDITGHRALFVKPNTIWDIPFTPTDPNFKTRNFADTANAAGFVTAVDVYRVYNDTTTVAELLSDPIFHQTTALGTYLLSDADVLVTNPTYGRFSVRTECLSACRYPVSQVKVYYKSGYPLEFGAMAMDMQRGLIRLTNANMYRKLCSFCPETSTIWDEDRLAAGTAENPVAQRWIDNPFGTMKGQVAAWQSVYRKALAEGGVFS